MLRPSRIVKALLAGLRTGHMAWREPPAAVSARHRRAATLVVSLPEEAVQFAHTSDVSPPKDALAKFLASPVDASLGQDRLCRHATLTGHEANRLHDYFRRCAEAAVAIGDARRALICAKGRAAIRLELWKGGLERLR
jgi:hypothetical protein